MSYHLSKLNKGLVGHWTMSQDSLKSLTILADKTPYGNDGTIYGATFAADRKGKANSAMSFDGVDDYIDCGNDSSLDITDAITLEAWIYKNVGGQSFQRIVQKGNVNQAYGLLFESTTTLKARLYLGADTDFTLQTNFDTGKWKHVVMTYDSHYIKGYVDGVNVYTSADQNCTIGTIGHNLQIGRRGDGHTGTYFNGLIDDVRIYNRALSAEEIKLLYESYNPILKI